MDTALASQMVVTGSVASEPRTTPRTLAGEILGSMILDDMLPIHHLRYPIVLSHHKSSYKPDIGNCVE